MSTKIKIFSILMLVSFFANFNLNAMEECFRGFPEHALFSAAHCERLEEILKLADPKFIDKELIIDAIETGRRHAGLILVLNCKQEVLSELDKSRLGGSLVLEILKSVASYLKSNYKKEEINVKLIKEKILIIDEVISKNRKELIVFNGETKEAEERCKFKVKGALEKQLIKEREIR